MKKIIYTLLLSIVFFCANGQQTTTEIRNWLGQNIVDLKTDYLKRLDEKLGSNKVIGLGEASHGTEEFYREKNKIIQHLITDMSYVQLGFEFPNTYIEKVNRYVLSGEGDLKTIMADFRLYRTKSFFDLFEWIKNYNATAGVKKVEVFGFDNADYVNPFIRDSLMAANVIDRQFKVKGKFIVWGHNLHLSRDTTAGYKPFGYFLSKKYKKSYFNIAFDTYQGTVNTITLNGEGALSFDKHSLEVPVDNFTALFSEQKCENFYIYLWRGSPLSGVKNTITNIYADWRKPYTIPVRFDDDFDALIFIKTTHASVLLD